MFAGIGGFHIAIDKYCKENNLKSNCVFTSEIDSYAKQTYCENFKVKQEEIINIRDVDEFCNQIKDHDILFAGFPCQTFSNAGHRKGFLDEVRGTLFFDIAKILKNKKPKYFLLENVKHLTRHDNGKTWKIICDTLTKLGYVIPKTPLIVSPHELGILQDRARVFIPGILKDNKNINEDVFDNFKDKIIENKFNHKFNYYLEKNVDDKYSINPYLESVLEAWSEFVKNVKRPNNSTLPVVWLFDLKTKYTKEELNKFPIWKQKYLKDMQSLYKDNKEFIDLWMKKHNTKNWKKRDQKLEWQAGINEYDLTNTFVQLRQSGIRCRRKEKFPTLVAIVQVPIIFDKNKNKFRHLTPRETANLQSFPKSFKLFNQINDHHRSDYYSYKQFGNSVNVEVVYRIIKELLNEK